jgi:hypothetical protein
MKDKTAAQQKLDAAKANMKSKKQDGNGCRRSKPKTNVKERIVWRG